MSSALQRPPSQWLLEPGAVDMHAAVVAFLARMGLDFGDMPPFTDHRSGSEHPMNSEAGA